MHSLVSTPQVSFSHPGTQVQLNDAIGIPVGATMPAVDGPHEPEPAAEMSELLDSQQVAPLEHGLLVHSSTSASQSSPE